MLLKKKCLIRLLFSLPNPPNRKGKTGLQEDLRKDLFSIPDVEKRYKKLRDEIMHLLSGAEEEEPGTEIVMYPETDLFAIISIDFFWPRLILFHFILVSSAVSDVTRASIARFLSFIVWSQKKTGDIIFAQNHSIEI